MFHFFILKKTAYPSSREQISYREQQRPKLNKILRSAGFIFWLIQTAYLHNVYLNIREDVTSVDRNHVAVQLF